MRPTGSSTPPASGEPSAPTSPRSTDVDQASDPGRLRRALRAYLDGPFASVQLVLIAGVGLLGIGLLMAASTTISASLHTTNDAMWSQLIKQSQFLLLGSVAFWIGVRLRPEHYRRLAWPLLALAMIALVAVLVPGIGVKINVARRWIDLGPLPFQPSEFAKLAALLWGADLLARKTRLNTLTRARHVFVPLVPVFVAMCVLIMLEPDLGTTLCFLLILMALLWYVGLPIRYFGMVAMFIVAAVIALAISAPYRLERLTSFADPFADSGGTGFHAVQGLYALASGGLFGVGLGRGTSKYGWVPNANTDYVFSVIGEELGLLGCAVVLSLFGLFAYAALRIARRSLDPFVRLVAAATAVWVCGQALINVGYVTALLPVTGIPLPFISAGGTSLLLTCAVLGMLVSLARHETAATAVIRERHRLAGLERIPQRRRVPTWLRLPVPNEYVEPAAKPATRPATKPTGRPGGTPAVARPAAIRAPGRPVAPAAQARQVPRTGVVRPPLPDRRPAAPLRPTGTTRGRT